jgi:hypothetical protein
MNMATSSNCMTPTRFAIMPASPFAPASITASPGSPSAVGAGAGGAAGSPQSYVTNGRRTSPRAVHPMLDAPALGNEYSYMAASAANVSQSAPGSGSVTPTSGRRAQVSISRTLPQSGSTHSLSRLQAVHPLSASAPASGAPPGGMAPPPPGQGAAVGIRRMLLSSSGNPSGNSAVKRQLFPAHMPPTGSDVAAT